MVNHHRNTNQLKPIIMKELKITKGELKNEGGDNTSIDLILSNNATITISRYNRYDAGFAMEREEMEADADLIAEVFTVANQCGLTHKELLEQVEQSKEVIEELVKALEEARSALSFAQQFVELEMIDAAYVEVRKAINKIRNNEKQG